MDKHQLGTQLYMLFPHRPHMRLQLDGLHPKMNIRSCYYILFLKVRIESLVVDISTLHSKEHL